MNVRKTILLFIMVLLGLTSQAQQIIFNKNFDNAIQWHWIHGVSAFELESGNIFVIKSDGLMLTDAYGIKLWEIQRSGISQSLRIGNNQYLVAERTSLNNLKVTNIDTLGNYNWQTTISNNFQITHRWLPHIQFLYLEQEGIFMLVSETETSTANRSDFIKLDSMGNIEWVKSLKDPGHGMVEAHDSGIIMVGCEDSIGSSFGKHSLIRKFDYSGNLIWSKSLEPCCDGKTGVNIIQYDTSYLALFADGSPFESPIAPAYITRISKNGNRIIDPDFDIINLIHIQGNPGKLLQLKNGSIAFTQWSRAADEPGMDTWYHSDINISLWPWDMVTLYPSIYLENMAHSFGVNHISETTDGGLLLVGETDTKFNEGLWDVGRLRLVRIDSNLQTTVSLTPRMSSNESLEFFPNPADTRISISQLESYTHFTILDRLGNKILETQDINELDLSNIPNGLYLLQAQIKDSRDLVSSKIMIRH